MGFPIIGNNKTVWVNSGIIFYGACLSGLFVQQITNTNKQFK